MEIRILDDQFDSAVYNVAAHHPLQTWEWGEARKATGLAVVRFGQFSGYALKNVFQMTLHPVPYTPWRIGYLPRSVVPDKEVCDFLRVYGQKNGCICIKIEPYALDSSYENPEFVTRHLDQVDSQVFKSLGYIQKSATPLFPQWTLMLDLSQSPQAISDMLKQKTRYNVKLAAKKGVTVTEESSDTGFADFLDLYMQTCQRQKYKGHSRKYHQIIYTTLKAISHILIARFEKKPLAAYELFVWKNILFYPYGGSSDEHRNIMAPHALMWAAIQFGIDQKCQLFDMWGAAPPPEDGEEGHSWDGFSRFKLGFGAKYVKCIGSFDIVTGPFVVYQLYTWMYAIRSRVLRL